MTLGYQKLGNGNHKVIGLHGWFGDHTTYDPMRTALSLDEFTYVFPAYRGYGLSRHLSGNYSNKEIAADVIALADELGWDRFSLIGHSMGGKAIQRVLVDAPKRVQQMVGGGAGAGRGGAIRPADAGAVRRRCEQHGQSTRHHRLRRWQPAVESLGRLHGAVFGADLDRRGLRRLLQNVVDGRVRRRGAWAATCRSRSSSASTMCR